MLASSSIVGHAIMPAVTAVTAVASESVVNTIVSLNDVSAVMAASIPTEYRRVLFVDTGHMAAQVFQVATVADLFESQGKMRARIFSRILNIFDDNAQMSSNIVENRINSLFNDVSSMSVTLLPKVVIDDLFVSRGTMAVEIHDAITVLLTDAGAMSAQILGKLRVKQLLTDAGAMSAQILGGLTIGQLFEDTASMTASVLGRLNAYNLIESSAAAAARVIDGLPITAWSAPTDSLAMTRYTLPPLNSLAPAGAALLMAGDDGIFERAGADDDGAQIVAHAKTNLMDFGDPKLKRPENVYVGYSTNGAVGLLFGATRAVSGDNGQERSWSYTNGPHTYANSTGGRFQPGRGIESRYFRLTFTNVEGSALALRGVTITYLPMSRRF